MTIEKVREDGTNVDKLNSDLQALEQPSKLEKLTKENQQLNEECEMLKNKLGMANLELENAMVEITEIKNQNKDLTQRRNRSQEKLR